MLLCGSRPRRCRQTGRIGLLWLGLVLLSQPAGAQSIDTRRSQATIGEPVEMSLQVRAFDIPPALLGRTASRCACSMPTVAKRSNRSGYAPCPADRMNR